MTTINLNEVRNELCNLLRSSDVLSTTIRGVTRVSSNYTASASESSHTFTGYTPVKNIKTLTVDGVAKYYLRDYTMNWNTGVLSWNSNLTGGETVAYVLDYGSGDKIYPDYPRDDLTLTSFPRVGIEMTSISTTPLGLGGANHMSDMLWTVYVWVSANKDTNIASGFGGQTDLETTMNLIRSAVRTNAKLLYTIPWIYPLNTSPILRGQYDKVLQQSQDFRVRFRVE